MGELKRLKGKRIYSLKNVMKLLQDTSHNNRVSKLSALKSSCSFKSKSLHSSSPLWFPFQVDVKAVPTQQLLIGNKNGAFKKTFSGFAESGSIYAAANQYHSWAHEAHKAAYMAVPLLSPLPRLQFFLPQLFQLRHLARDAARGGCCIFVCLAPPPTQPCLIGPPLVRAAVRLCDLLTVSPTSSPPRYNAVSVPLQWDTKEQG